MLEAVSLFIFCFITHILDCVIFGKFINKKLKINLKIAILCLSFATVDCIFNMYSISSKFIITNLITVLLLEIVYKKSFSKSLLGAVFTYIAYAISEIFFSLIFIVILRIDPDFFISNYIGSILANIFIFMGYYLIFKIKYIIKFIGFVLNWYEEKNILKLLLKVGTIILLIYTIIYSVSFDKLVYKNGIFVLLTLLAIIMFVVGYFNEKSNNNQLTVKYDNLLDYVKDYELEVVEKGKAIHEHKNQLAVIDDMIPKSNKKLKEYVSEKLDKVSKLDDNVWLEKLTNLPTGGTKGLVYLKIKKMLDNNISIYVEIDDDLKTKNKWNNVSKNLEDYTRILGVYLDNAIEASIESKDKQIIIEFIDNKDNIEFILSNTYKGRINVEEIDKEKYSTKGKGRGYGLSLVKDIVEKNKLISQSREINGKFYVQKLYIKK